MANLSDIRIIFSDIDGTLLPFSGKDLAPTAELIGQLTDRGIEFVPCTGRGTHNIPPAILAARGVRYAITANGALVVDLAEGKVLRERTVDPETALSMLRLARGLGAQLFCYRYGVHFIDNTRPVPVAPPGFTSLRDWLNTVIPIDFEELIQDPETHYLDKMGLFSFDPDFKLYVQEEMKKAGLYEKFAITTSMEWNLELNAAGGTKGDSAVWLAGQLGYAPQEILTAGDNLNDMSMILAGAISVAPENAVPAVKEAASVVVPDCRDDGVEDFFRKLLK